MGQTRKSGPGLMDYCLSSIRKPSGPPGLKDRVCVQGYKLFFQALKMQGLDGLYQQTLAEGPQEHFPKNLLKVMGVTYSLHHQRFNDLPGQGHPVVIVANHPFGGLEAMVLAAALAEFRSDVRFLANSLLGVIPELRNLIIPVDPFGGLQSRKTNLQGVRSALSWLKNGGLLCLFPAGEVAHWQWRTRTVTDPPWQSNAIRLIRKSKADVLPVFIPGCNSRRFHSAGLIHPRLRTALLSRELLNKQGLHIRLRTGELIASSTLKRLPSTQVATWYLRARTFALEEKNTRKRIYPRLFLRGFGLSRRYMPVAAPFDHQKILKDIQELPRSQLLVQSNDLCVFEARAGQIPYLLHEIGRLREMTFRQEGEGSGRPLDLDLFDQTYDHLVLWNSQRQEVAGAYRIGRVDRLLQSSRGTRALYTSTLFHFKQGFFENKAESLELGRSFIATAYQREYAPLLMLWKGIGRYVFRRPKYRYLFGPVSISQAYTNVSVQSLINHLHSKFSLPELAVNVQGRRSPKFKIKKYEWGMIQSISSLDTPMLDSVIADIESNHRRIPVLLRQYLKLGGKIAGFHHDRFFGSFDGLIVVDLLQTDPRFLKRFMGRTEAEDYLRFHSAKQPEQAVSA